MIWRNQTKKQKNVCKETGHSMMICLAGLFYERTKSGNKLAPPECNTHEIP